MPQQVLRRLACPACGGALAAIAERLDCGGCGRRFSCDEGIPRLFWPHENFGSEDDVTEVVKSFYEENPFPNYEDSDSRETLEAKARRAVLADVLDRHLPRDAAVIEAGCGTGQLSNFLALASERQVVGADLCLNSLRLGHGFAVRNHIANVAFVQMNLFRPAFQRASFDLVVSNGVLHHTSNAFEGFRSIMTLLKPGGLTLIGLYNRAGRIMTNVRRKVFDIGGQRLAGVLDPRLRNGNYGALKQRTWFMDQYRHPHESQHTIGEVLHWFDHCGIEFVNSLPTLDRSANLANVENVFTPHVRRGVGTRALVQAQMAVADREGGFFVMIGRKRGS